VKSGPAGTFIRRPYQVTVRFEPSGSLTPTLSDGEVLTPVAASAGATSAGTSGGSLNVRS
jgi:hypothetical protein